MANGQSAVHMRSAAREWRGLGRLVLESFAAGAAISVFLLVAVLLVASRAQAATPGRSFERIGAMAGDDDTVSLVAETLRPFTPGNEGQGDGYTDLVALHLAATTPVDADSLRQYGVPPETDVLDCTNLLGTLPGAGAPDRIEIILGLLALVAAGVVWRIGTMPPERAEAKPAAARLWRLA